jgi:hypothetical protein
MNYECNQIDATQIERNSYDTPALVIYGSFADLTKTTGATGGKDGGGGKTRP